MGGRAFCTLLVFILSLFHSSGANLTKKLAIGVDFRQQENISYIAKSQKDITTPITTVPTTIGTPIVIPNSDPDSTTTPMVTPTTTTTTAPVSGGASWCIASPGASAMALQVALDYACGYGGADCTGIQEGGFCYNPNTLQHHASFAFNSFYQKSPIPSSCNFGGTATTTSTDPSTQTCKFPSTSTSSSVLNTTNANGATVYGAVPSTPSPPKSSAPNIDHNINNIIFIATVLNMLIRT